MGIAIEQMLFLKNEFQPTNQSLLITIEDTKKAWKTH
jgi:hypothetical protein